MWPPYGYEGQLNQVESQLDGAFGAFGQSMSLLKSLYFRAILNNFARFKPQELRKFAQLTCRLVLFDLVPNDPQSAWAWGDSFS